MHLRHLRNIETVLLKCKKYFNTGVKNETRITATTPLQHCIEFSTVSNMFKNCNKDICLENKDMQLTLFAENMFIYLENPKE